MTEHESKELFRQHCRPGGHLSRQNGGSMKQHVSRRRSCWTLLVQMDPVIHFSEGHRSEMLLDLSGLTREERVMVQVSISNERDFDPTSAYTPPREPKVEGRVKGKDGVKRVDNSNVRWFRAEKAKASTLAVENLERVPIKRTSLPLKNTIITMMKT